MFAVEPPPSIRSVIIMCRDAGSTKEGGASPKGLKIGSVGKSVVLQWKIWVYFGTVLFMFFQLKSVNRIWTIVASQLCGFLSFPFLPICFRYASDYVVVQNCGFFSDFQRKKVLNFCKYLRNETIDDVRGDQTAEALLESYSTKLLFFSKW